MNEAVFPFVNPETRRFLDDTTKEALKIISTQTGIEFDISQSGLFDVNLEEGYSTECLLPVKNRNLELPQFHILALQEGEGTGSFDSFRETQINFLEGYKDENPNYSSLVPIDYSRFDAVYLLPLALAHGTRSRLLGFDIDMTTAEKEKDKVTLYKTRITNNFQEVGIGNFISPIKKGESPLEMQILKLVGAPEEELLANFALSFPRFESIFGPDTIGRYTHGVAAPLKQRFQIIAIYTSYDSKHDSVVDKLEPFSKPYHRFISNP